VARPAAPGRWVVLILPCIEQGNLYQQVESSIDIDPLRPCENGWRSISNFIVVDLARPNG
jgi:hypothetical protein